MSLSALLDKSLLNCFWVKYFPSTSALKLSLYWAKSTCYNTLPVNLVWKRFVVDLIFVCYYKFSNSIVTKLFHLVKDLNTRWLFLRSNAPCNTPACAEGTRDNRMLAGIVRLSEVVFWSTWTRWNFLAQICILILVNYCITYDTIIVATQFS